MKKLNQNLNQNVQQLFFGALALLASEASALKVLSYNVQNLFDTVDNPKTNDEEFTPQGAQAWTERVLKDKIKNLGKVISAESPDIIAVQEVENQAILERLTKEGLKKQGYVATLAGPSDDLRGIRNGIISRFPIASTKSHRVWRESWAAPGEKPMFTRDILEVTLATPNHEVTVLVSHWPSRKGGAAREVVRLEVAEQMTAIIEGIVRDNPKRLVISLGDFNDELENNSFVKGLKMVSKASDLATAPLGSVFATDSELSGLSDEQSGTFFFHPAKEWNRFDHILISQGSQLASGSSPGFQYRLGSMRIVRPAAFMLEGKYPTGCEIVPGAQTGRSKLGCAGGASDHLPVLAEFDYK